MEESIKIEEAIAKALKLETVDPRTYSPLVLAYIGDAVYELLIRTKVINHGSMQVNKMHKKSASLVKAETQANIIKAIQDDLTESLDLLILLPALFCFRYCHVLLSIVFQVCLIFWIPVFQVLWISIARFVEVVRA